jgi:hypothetical protein
MPSLPKELTLLKHLHELSLSTQDAPSGPLPKAQRDAAFRAYGIDPAKTAEVLKARVNQLGSARRMAVARDERLAAQSAHQKQAEALATAGAELRAHVERLLKKLALNQPELAAVYCRKYEQATESDIVSLKEDLLLLEQLEGDGGHEPRPSS